MSGFGGGFGSGPPNMQPFGTPAPPMNPQQQQQQNQFGSGGFGNFQASGGFGSGFGTSPPNFGGGFGGSSQQPQPTNTTPFGASTTNSFASTPAPFGNTAPGGTIQFGTAPSQPSFGASNTMSGFGSTPAQTPFGQHQPTGSGASSFGSTTSTFGNTPAVPFGTSSGGFNTPAVAPAGPFGSTGVAAAPSTTISFGVSSNIAPTPPQNSGFGAPQSSTTPFSNSSTAFGTSNTTSSSSPAFGISTANSFAPASGFGGDGMTDNEEDMMDGGGGGFGTAPFSSTSPFGASTSSATEWVRQPSNDARVSSPVPSGDTMQDSSMSPTPPTNSTRDEELAQLKARKAEILRKKKKKLEELKRRKEQQQAAAASALPSSSLSASAPSFVPNEARSAPDDASSSLADRNAARFARPETNDSLLPEELRNRQGAVASGYKDDGPEEAQDFDNAISLVGTCPYMCPDDELIRRQQEGDIQLLETPQPGSIHPSDWTLRNTAVKRFRRSAADYKLDVPAWVRPPDVLEAVCGYLEEWVMERDRQGPDPRFPQSENPPSLDVYQFIWDRTRMVRKDFTLQNYVGTGGKCDAAAVRCHERIARWHAMCEHQLSHIPEFVNAQSQQNMEQLGQAMKTLNQFYDDSLGRSIVEVPDDDGNETLTDLSGISHGCTSDIVMGVSPTDFDGTPLKNDAASINVSKRLIGPQAANSPGHGTAEPEMRGLYILTTMHNDGGMEVLKHATYLHSNRPEIYNSKPVQLAMNIFKAKKEYNYAKFFSLLKDPETPYLFACIMFKHVEQMRRYAFRIMSKTYGGIVRKTKQILDDGYPIRDLVNLLCFEDESEAIEACRHYNITVEESQATIPNSPATSSQAMVYWKRSSYREPRDPEKGFVLTLKPRKMSRTIESKLNGATRLAVCRGEVSGGGAALSSISVSPSSRRDAAVPAPFQAPSGTMELSEQAETDEQTAKRRVEERRRLREEKKLKEEEKRRREEIDRKQKEEAKRQALLLKKQKEEEAKKEQARVEEERRRKQVEEERRRQLELEEAKRAAEAAAREEQLRREAEERRLAEERAKAERKAEAERLELLRQEELRKQREEEERLERIRREEEEKKRLEEERIRQEQERLRQEQLRLQREREERERRMREEKERRIAAAKEAKMNQARKLLVWRRLRSRLESELRKERTRQSLNRLDPTFSNNRTASIGPSSSAIRSSTYNVGMDMDARSNTLPGVLALDRLSRQLSEPLDLSTMLRKVLCSLQQNLSSVADIGDVMLTKVAVVLPTFAGPKSDSMRSLVHDWIGKRLQYGNIMIDSPASGKLSFEIRTVSSAWNASNSDCDMALLVIPPCFDDDSSNAYPAATFPLLDGVAARTVLCLDDGTNPAYASVVNNILSTVPQDVPFFQVGEEPQLDVFNVTLEEACASLLQSFVTTSFDIHSRGGLVRLSIAQLASGCIRSALWAEGIQSVTNEESMIMHRSLGIMIALMAELKSLSTLCRRSGAWSNYPAREFVNRSGVVPDYFGDGLDLPAHWKNHLSQEEVEPAVMALYEELDGSSFLSFIDRKTVDAPEHVKQDCREMLAKRQFRRCFEYVLMWEESVHLPSPQDTIVYVPKKSVADVVDGCIRRIDLDGDSDDFTLPEIDSSDQLEGIEEVDENAFALGWMQAMRSPQVLLEETSPRVPRRDTFVVADDPEPLAESVATPGGNIMSPPVGVQTPSSPPVGVETPASVQQPVDLLGGANKRLLDSGDGLRSTKRRRESPLSKDQKDSLAFTQKLESMLRGETVSDIKVGNTKLADLLRNAPDIELP